MTRREFTDQVKNSADVGEAKSDLMRVLVDLENNGLQSEADKLGKIIARLEYWQNS